MSSPTTSPYKSRLLNFINRQYIHFSDRLEKTARQLKVAAEWGVQILIYPVYLLVQTGRMAGRQLEQKVEQAQLPKSTPDTNHQQPPSADKPIEQVLKVVEPWLSPTIPPSTESGFLTPYSRESKGAEGAGEDTTRIHERGCTDNTDKLIGVSAIKRIWAQILKPVKEKVPLQAPAKASEASNIQTIPAQDIIAQYPTELKQPTEASRENPIVIQGVATLTETRTLVFVTRENQILDILTQEQQQKLQQRISWEIADYWHEWRLAQAAARKFPGLLPSFKTNSSNVLPPVRLFWKMMRWVQTSPVAIAINLFGESTLVLTFTPTPRPTAPNTPPVAPTGVLATLDDTVADLEAQQLVPAAQIAHTLGDRFRGLGQQLPERLNPFHHPTTSPETSEPNPFQIQSLISAAIDYFFGKHREQFPIQGNDAEALILPQQRETAQLPGNSSASLPTASSSEQLLSAASEEYPQLPRTKLTPTLGDRLRGLLQKLKTCLSPPQDSIVSPEASQPDPFQIQVLIRAAVDYFFGKHRGQFLPKGNDTSAVIPPEEQGESHNLPTADFPTQQLPAASEEDPWLSWEDLFDDAASTEVVSGKSRGHRPSNSPEPAQLSGAPKTPIKPGNSRNLSRRRRQKSKSLQFTKSAPNNLTKTQNRPGTVDHSPSNCAPFTQSQTEDTTLEPAPDWVETKATPMGYVKHPLERILECLDRIMLWLEEHILSIWHWILNILSR
ncbi:MAG: hypothetical protein AB4426_13020 [Xenococcaceae cyanobacterium]